MRQRLLFFTLFILTLFLLPAFARAAVPEDQLAGTIEADAGGRSIYFPTLKTDVSADIAGDLATVTVVQTFANPTSEPLHAKYLFPLNHDAAVYEMTMEVGKERIRAVIHETQEAQKIFDKAKSEGKAAALLKEHRPNMFTQDIANLMPGLPIKVTLRYVQTVPKQDGAYELLIPMIVGPRFQPPGAGQPPQETGELKKVLPPTASGTWELEQLPSYPPVLGLDVPPAIEPERVSLNIRINGGMPIRDARSETHSLSIRALNSHQWDIGFAQGRVIDNRDFVLRYWLSGSRTQAGLLTQNNEHGGYFSLLLEPPAAPADSDIVPREMVFLLDCSGSMYGLPMDASKAFMREALHKLRPTDHFRIIRFSDSATEFSGQPLVASAENVRKGIAYVNSLNGEGGTMMTTGIRQALSVPPPEGTQRIVTFLTDGYIGNEYEILGMIQQFIGSARLYAFGVGTGVNHFLMDEIGRAGRGFTRYMDPTENVEKIAAELAERLQSPVLTDIEVDWGELKPDEVYPQKLPDLFAGQSVRVQGRFAKAGDYTVTVRGQSRGRKAVMTLPLHLVANSGDGDAVSLVWARSAIAEAMYQMTLPNNGRDIPGEQSHGFDILKQRVTDLGLKFSLVTKWTSFVAVSEQIYNAHPDTTHDSEVPLPMVKGITERAYGQRATTFAGASGPEASSYASLLVILLLAALALRRRPAAQGRLG